MDYKFFKIPNTDLWVVLNTRRENRPHIHKVGICPFCPENINNEHSEVYRIGGEVGDTNWDVIVIPNKYPFAPIHELVIQSREHKQFQNLTLDEFRLSISVFVNRFNTHKDKGKVCIFANSGHDAGESIGHAHTQIAVVPSNIDIESPKLEKDLSCYGECLQIGEFVLMSPPYSQWPDEVWIVPKQRDKMFGDIEYKEIDSLAFILKRLINIFNIRHEGDYPFNFYIYPGNDWYLRLLTRAKILGGFEIATGIYVNTQDPKETIKFIKSHFYEREVEKIKKNKAGYRKGV